jgi:two-component system sensor histidine kinase and response regulator WspE
VVHGCQVMNLPGSNSPKGEVCIVIISDRLNRYGLAIDRFLDRRDVVVMPLDGRLGRIPNVSAGAILEDGSPVLILDVDDLVRSIDNLLTHGRLQKVGGRKEQGDVSKKRILVVDDSLTVREVERRLLENSGYQVTVAVDGMDGWNTLQLEGFDLVVSDVDMPRMNGIEFIRKIKSDPKFKDTPVIIVSYKDREEDRLRGLEAGANYYLTKSSFQDEGLNNAVRDLIGEA